MSIKITITNEEKEFNSKSEAIAYLQQPERKGLWRPDCGEQYYYIDSWGNINTETWDEDEPSDQVTFAIGNVFRTQALAQAEVDRRKALTKIKDYIAREFGECGDAQWFVYCNGYGLEVSEALPGYKYAEMIPYLATKSQALQLIKDCEAELKVVFGLSKKICQPTTKRSGALMIR